MDYRKEFLESIKATAANEEDGTVASFVREAGDSLLDAGVIPDYESCFYTTIGKRNRKMRIDGYAFDDLDLTMTLIVAEYNGSDECGTLTLTDAKQCFERLMFFLEEATNGGLINEMEISTPTYDLVDLLRAYSGRVRMYRFILLTDNVASDRIGTLPYGYIKEVQIEYHIWDIGRLFRVCGSEGGREELEINLYEYIPDGISCLEAGGTRTDEYRSFLCVIPGTVLADIYDRYGSRLLEGNVRSFLSTKVAVNKKIRSTILSQPTKFFAFNNGIAATATEVVIEERQGRRHISFVKGFQIVNGGQTTASLSNSRYKDKADISQIYVQMKLTEVESSVAETFIPQISRSSNSQNRVSEADFFSNHPFHIRMEKMSRRLFAPAVGGAQYETHWFYERARGQFLQEQGKMTKGEKGKFILQNPKSQMITKTDLAKYRNLWVCLPHKVSLGAQKNFVIFAEWVTDEWEKNDANFNEIFFQESVALALLFRHVEKLVSSQTWYEKGYRANIVAYSLAFLSHLLRKQYTNKRFDFQSIWNKQAIPEVLDRQMIIIAKIVFDVLTAPDRAIQNVTEWSKKEACWDKVKQLDISLMDGINDLMLDGEELRGIIKTARKQQKVTDGIEIQTTVIGFGNEYWIKISKWGHEKNLLSFEEQKLLSLAERIVSSMVLPNTVQCEKLLGYASV